MEEALQVETEVLQGLPISLILFAIYLTEIFKPSEKELKGCMTTSFAGECRGPVTAGPVAKLCEQLERARLKAMEGEVSNPVIFDNVKGKKNVCTSRMKLKIKSMKSEVRTTVCWYTIDFNTEDTR